MMRPLLTVLLIAHVVTAHAVSAQELSPSASVTGHFDSPFRQYGFGASASAGPELPPVVSSIVTHFLRDETLEGVTAARALRSASASELALGIATLRERLFTLPDDGTALRPAVFALMAELKAHIARLPLNDGAAPARELDRGNVDAHKQRMATFMTTYEGTPAYYHHIISQVESEFGYDASRMRQRSRELATQFDRTEHGAHALYTCISSRSRRHHEAAAA